MSCAVCKMFRAVDSADEEEEQAEEDCLNWSPLRRKGNQREVKEEEEKSGPGAKIPVTNYHRVFR